MSTPTLGTSVVMGIRASAREAWLLPLSLAVSLLRAASYVPAFAVASILPFEGALQAARLRPLSLGAFAEGALAVLTSSRYLAMVAGLWLAAWTVSGLLRVLFLAGALPTVGARLAGEDSPRRFAPGIAYGFPRQLATWLLAGVVEVTAVGYLLAVCVATLQAGAGTLREEHPLTLALASAAMLTLGAAGILVARVLGDAAAARAAILGEGPGRAFAGALRRYISRPGAFTLGGAAVILAGLALTAALQPASGVASMLSHRVTGAVALGPQLMVSLVAGLGAAAVDLVWLSTVSVLACARVPAPSPPGPPFSA